MAKYVCIRTNYGFQGRLIEKGEVVEVSDRDLEHPSITHFAPLDGGNPKAADSPKPKKATQKPAE